MTSRYYIYALYDCFWHSIYSDETRVSEINIEDISKIPDSSGIFLAISFFFVLLCKTFGAQEGTLP
jgi:hypothetical protein